MYKQNRQQMILNLIYKSDEVSISELSSYFKVSDMTIRRDLDKLSRDNLIRRTRGGAVANKIQFHEQSYTNRSTAMQSEKMIIAEKAINQIQFGDVIILDSGTTAQEIAKRLKTISQLNITVIINDFIIYEILKHNRSIDLIFAGGSINKEYPTITSGSLSINFFQNFKVNKAFMAMMAVDIDEGVFHSNLDVATSKKSMIDAASVIYLIVDHSKFNKQAMFKITSIDKIDYIITDDIFDQEKYNIPQHIKII